MFVISKDTGFPWFSFTFRLKKALTFHLKSVLRWILCFSLSKNVFISPSFPKGIFLQKELLYDDCFSFIPLKMFCSYLCLPWFPMSNFQLFESFSWYERCYFFIAVFCVFVFFAVWLWQFWVQVFFWFILFGFAEGVEYTNLFFIRFETFWIGIPADIFFCSFFFNYSGTLLMTCVLDISVLSHRLYLFRFSFFFFFFFCCSD